MNISTFRNTLKDRFVIFQVCGKTLVRCPHVHWKNRKLLYYISLRYLHRAQETLKDNTHSQSLLTLLTPDKRYRSVHCHQTTEQLNPQNCETPELTLNTPFHFFKMYLAPDWLKLAFCFQTPPPVQKDTPDSIWG